MLSIVLIYPASYQLRRTLTLVILASLFFWASACAKRSRTVMSKSISSPERQNIPSSSQQININRASAKQLEVLPGIGKGLAERIVEHRQKYGRFAKPEHLIMVRGISEHRFRAIRDQITVD